METRRRRWLGLGSSFGLSLASGCVSVEPGHAVDREDASVDAAAPDLGGGESSAPPDAVTGLIWGAIPFGDDPCRSGACRAGAYCVDLSGRSCRCSERASTVCSALDFQTLPLTPDAQTCSATSVSADGAVLGDCSGTNHGAAVAQAVRWTSSAGAEVLPKIDASRLGSDFGGGSATDPCYLQYDAGARQFSLRRVGAPFDVALVAPPGGELFPQAHSPDCQVVVGSFQTLDGPSRAFRWSVTQGLVLFEPSTTGDIAFDVSDDGNTIVGSHAHASGPGGAVRWDATGAVEELPSPPGVAVALARAISADGSVIIGYSVSPVRSVRWTVAGVEVLGDGDVALSTLSADGRLAFGRSGEGVWVWQEELGLRRLMPWLVDSGTIDPQWDIWDVTGVSSDATLIVGSLRNTHENELRPRFFPFRLRWRGVP